MKPGKNDLCICGSGKKYKHCCIGKIAPRILLPTVGELNQLIALFNTGRFVEVENRVRLLVERYPDSGFAWKLLGATLHRLSKDALPALKKATKLLPNDAEAHYNLGVTHENLGQLEEAVVAYQQAIQIKSDFAAAYNNLGNALRDLGQLNDAFTYCKRALEIQPGFAGAHSNLGSILSKLGRAEEAIASFHKALAINPDFAEAHNNLGGTLLSLRNFDAAMASYRQALKSNPDFAVAHSNLLFCLSHTETVNEQALFAEHRRFAEQFEAPLRANWPQHSNSRDPERCLQVGFVSGDFCNHAVAYFIESVLAHLAGRPQLSLHAYYNHVIEDNVTQRLRGYMTYWHSTVGLSDDALAQKIREDNIDILIDLSGHTAKHRLLTFTRKPVPVQASWMGYPGTTGLSAMDYYFADRFLLPLGQFAGQFTEKIVHLPANAPFLPSADAPPVNTLPALSNGFITFGSFNRPSKIGRPVVALWSQLLRILPNSRLLLGAMSKEEKYDTLIEWFAQEGVAQDRLSFHVRSGINAYLAQHQQVDICLDTFPYNGGTTTCHALWMGVPTLTLAGKTVPGRQGAAVMGHVGLDAFVAHDAADFVQKGLSWAGDISALSDIRTGLRERFAQSVMGRPAVIAAGVERALRIMWQRWCAGLPAESFDVSLKDINSVVEEVGK